MFNLNLIRDFLDFIRFKLSFFGAFLGVLGYIMFKSPSLDLIFVFLSSFCAIAFGFAYNNIKDVKEDLLNRGTLNPLTTTKEGTLILVVVILIGLFSSLFMAPFSMFFYLIVVSAGTVYSFIRLKLIPVVKNIYVTFSILVVFLLGTGNLSTEIILYSLLLFVYIFVGSVIADLRDFEGDKSLGIRTLPTMLGYTKTKNIVYSFLLALTLLIFILHLTHFFLLGIFSLLVILFLAKKKPRHAHLLGGSSFLMTTLWVLMI